MLSMIFSDPVVWGSLLGIVIMVAMAAYYTYIFVHYSEEEDSKKQGSEDQIARSSKNS